MSEIKVLPAPSGPVNGNSEGWGWRCGRAWSLDLASALQAEKRVLQLTADSSAIVHYLRGDSIPEMAEMAELTPEVAEPVVPTTGGVVETSPHEVAVRQPRVWRAGDAHPEGGVEAVMDYGNHLWSLIGTSWVSRYGNAEAWADVARDCGPLVEVILPTPVAR